mgnify:CR=1 FL=1
MVTSMDDAIGQIVDAASQRLPRENTLIFFCSDNGGILRAGSNGDLRGEKSHVYEGGVRAPAIMVWEGTIKEGSVVKEPLHITDLYPTLLGLTEESDPLTNTSSSIPPRFEAPFAWVTGSWFATEPPMRTSRSH